MALEMRRVGAKKLQNIATKGNCKQSNHHKSGWVVGFISGT